MRTVFDSFVFRVLFAYLRFELSRPNCSFAFNSRPSDLVKKVQTKGGAFLPETGLKWMFMNLCLNSDS